MHVFLQFEQYVQCRSECMHVYLFDACVRQREAAAVSAAE